MIKFVYFRDPVTVGGAFSDLKTWDRSKHAEKYPLIERGPILILELPDGDDLEVPPGNVISIRRDREDRNRHNKSGNGAVLGDGGASGGGSKPGKERG